MVVDATRDSSRLQPPEGVTGGWYKPVPAKLQQGPYGRTRQSLLVRLVLVSESFVGCQNDEMSRGIVLPAAPSTCGRIHANQPVSGP